MWLLLASAQRRDRSSAYAIVEGRVTHIYNSIFASVVRLIPSPPIYHLLASEPISMATLELSLPSIIADIGSGNLSLQGLEMDEDDIDILDSPAEESSLLTPDQSSYEKQRANLAVYLDALPYKCDSLQEMQQRLEHIIEKLIICAESKNWSVLTTWDAMLQWQVPNPFSRHQISYSAQLAAVALPHNNLYSRQAC